MSGLSDELNEGIQGFELKQTRDRLKVMELKSKIKGRVPNDMQEFLKSTIMGMMYY